MEHDEIRELLGAYALHALDPDERAVVDEHLRECPRCAAEVAAYGEVAALLGNSTTEAPEDGWDRLARKISASESVPEWPQVRELLPLRPRQTKQRVLAGIGAAIFAAAAVSIALLGFHVANLDHQLARNSAQEIRAAAANATAGPHQEIDLSAAHSLANAKVVVSPNGEAYWISSSLPVLPATETYQLWALVNGAAVSLGVIGDNPHHDVVFLVQPTMRKLMVTAEQLGGTPQPTTPVLISGVYSA